MYGSEAILWLYFIIEALWGDNLIEVYTPV